MLQASPERLEVEVPEAVAESGGEERVDVVVKTGTRASAAVSVSVFQGPRLHGLSPEAALPGEEVLLAGAGWGVGATVRFGSAPAQVLEVQPTRIRAVVPEAAGTPGTAAPVVVTVGTTESNAAPFIVGHLPVVSGVAPASAAAGDTVTVSGRGFQPDPLRNDVRVGGVPALVLSAAPDALVVAVPRTGPGEPSRALEVRVPGSENVGQALVQVAPAADPVEFHFAAEPFTAAPGRAHAVVTTGLGPAFVLAASGGKTAAARAVEAAQRLNGAAQALRTTVGLNLEARGLDASPVLALAGKPEALLEVAEEDAAAYNEDWTGLRGRGGPVTRARLARWWEAVGRDLVLITVRGERPQFAAALAPEGRVLGQVFDAAQRTGRPGVPRQVVDEARPPLRDGLRLLALRVPASVTAPVAAAAAAGLPAAAATPAPARLQLEGTWAGSQVEQGQRQYVSATFRRDGGSISYEGGITLTVPLLALDPPRRDQVRFSVQIRGGIRHYVGEVGRRGDPGLDLDGRRGTQRRGDLRAAPALDQPGPWSGASAVEAEALPQLLALLGGERGRVERRSQARRVRGDRPVPAGGQQVGARLPHQGARVVPAHPGAGAVAVARRGWPGRSACSGRRRRAPGRPPTRARSRSPASARRGRAGGRSPSTRSPAPRRSPEPRSRRPSGGSRRRASTGALPASAAARDGRRGRRGRRGAPPASRPGGGDRHASRQLAGPGTRTQGPRGQAREPFGVRPCGRGAGPGPGPGTKDRTKAPGTKGPGTRGPAFTGAFEDLRSSALDGRKSEGAQATVTSLQR